MESSYIASSRAAPRHKPRRHFMHKEPLESPFQLETKDEKNLHIRLLLADEKYTLLVEAKDLKGHVWLLGLPMNFAKCQHKEVVEYWKKHLAITLHPLGGCIMKFENGSFVCGGFSGTFKKKVDVERYTRLFNDHLRQRLLHPPVRDSRYWR